MAASLPLLTHLSSRTLALAAMLALIVVAIPVLATFTARRLQQPAVAMGSKLVRYGRIMLVLWAIAALALFALRLYGQGPADVGLRPASAPFEYALGMVVAAMLIGLSATRSDIGSDYARRISVVIPQTRIEWVFFIALAATAGICEEFLYRGFALTKIAALTGSLAAGVVFSSIAFGAAHVYQGRMGMIGAGLSGFLYALVFIATGSLIPCMLGHFTQDVIGAALLSRRLTKFA